MKIVCGKRWEEWKEENWRLLGRRSVLSKCVAISTPQVFKAFGFFDTPQGLAAPLRRSRTTSMRGVWGFVEPEALASRIPARWALSSVSSRGLQFRNGRGQSHGELRADRSWMASISRRDPARWMASNRLVSRMPASHVTNRPLLPIWGIGTWSGSPSLMTGSPEPPQNSANLIPHRLRYPVIQNCLVSSAWRLSRLVGMRWSSLSSSLLGWRRFTSTLDVTETPCNLPHGE
jgi:hypothetical protein